METNDKIRHYVDDGIDISYDARRCIHAAECIRGLPVVFDSTRRPWIVPSAASADQIANVIAKCPSGALHFERRDGGPSETPQEPTTIEPTAGGALLCARAHPSEVGGWHVGIRGREDGAVPLWPVPQ
jgi:uncharacterized Fe-S cluster protein YjdI